MPTKRESEIFNLIKQGKSNKEIAKDLKISVHTVITTLYRAYKKYNIKNRNHIAAGLVKNI